MSETITQQTAEIVAAFVSHNTVHESVLPDLIAQVYRALAAANGIEIAEPAPAQEPAVPVKKSVTPDYIVCLEDGLQFRSLKRHIFTAYGLTPEQYRKKWGLPHDYPMVAPKYAEQRSDLAKKMGLGVRQKTAAKALKLGNGRARA